MTRRQRFLAASIAVGLVTLWALVAFWVGPAEIARAHRGESLPFLNGLLSGRATHPLQDYLDSWTRLTTGAGWLLAGAILVGYAMAELLGTGPGRRWWQTLVTGLRRIDAAARIKNRTSDLRLSDGLLISVGIGLATGAVEGFVQYFNRFVRGDLDFLMGPVGPEVVWLVPLVTGSIFLVIGGALCLGLLYVWPRVLRTSYLVLPLGTLGLFEVARASMPRFAWWAVAVLALGVSARVAYATRGAPRRTVKRVAALCVAVLLVTEVGAAVAPRLSERGRRTASASGDAPNVLFIILDTVRAANLSLYGYERPTTPVLEQLAERGITFDMAFVPGPWTLPSHASFFTGRFPHELEIGWLKPLDDTYPTVAEWLGQHGYATGGFVANMTVCGKQYGLDRGFDHYEAAPVSWRTALSNTWATRELIEVARQRFGYHRIFLRKSAEEVNGAFLDWQAEVDQPYFAFLNYFEAHAPYGPPQDSLRAFSAPGERYWFIKGGRNDTEDDLRQLRNAYDDGIHYIDSQIGILLEDLEHRGVLENTLVVITSDHGEEFKEHGHLGHGVTLYRQALHVPLLIIPPGGSDGGFRVASPVSLERLAATLVTMAGVGDGAPFPGLPLAYSDSGPEEMALPVLSESTAKPYATEGDLFSLIDEGHHYIVGEGNRELYDLAMDPEERHNLASTESGQRVMASLQAKLDEVLGGPGQ